MSTLGDALAALKNVVLIQERQEAMKKEVERLSADVGGLNAYAVSVDKRLVRIETMVELAERNQRQPRIEQ